MADAADSMHVDFPRWYREVGIGEDSGRRESRWGGVLKVVEDVEWATVEALIRLAFQTKQAPAASSVQLIRDCFKEADDAFDMSGNDRELQILAASCLAILLENSEEGQSSAAALAVTTTYFNGARSSALPMDLPTLAEAAIRRNGEKDRQRSTYGNLTIKPVALSLDAAVAKIEAQPDLAGVVLAFKEAATLMQAAFRGSATRQNSAFASARDLIRTQDEELSMLWWLTGQRSEDYGCPMDQVPVEAQPFVFAKELAGMTGFPPGPPSIRAILSRAGIKEKKKIAVTAAVNAPPPEWLQALDSSNDVSSVTTPLHFAVKRQLETGLGDAWVAGWSAVTDINAGNALPCLTMAELFYRERLILLHR